MVLSQKQIEEFQRKLNVEVKEIKDLQTQGSKLLQQRTQMAAQQNENDLVKQELDLMEEDASVYKLIGPVLVSRAWERRSSANPWMTRVTPIRMNSLPCPPNIGVQVPAEIHQWLPPKMCDRICVVLCGLDTGTAGRQGKHDQSGQATAKHTPSRPFLWLSYLS